MKTMNLLYIPLILLCVTNLSAQSTRGFLKRPAFGKHFVSEMHAPVNKIELGVGENFPEYDVSYDGKVYKIFQNTHLAMQLPLYADNPASDDTFGWALTMPVSMHVWWDIFEPTTAPILNTDYRFSVLEFRSMWRLRSKLLKNVSIRCVPFSHESTHIGDELTIYRNTSQLALTRVNVSYEYTEIAVTLNDPGISLEPSTSLRLGLMWRVNGKNGWYSIRSEDGDTSFVSTTSRKWEAYAQFNAIRTSGILASPTFVNVFSIELRNRVRYGYPLFVRESDEWSTIRLDEDDTWSANIYFGWQVEAVEGSYVGLYLHGYLGSNPYGQFRNIPRYTYALYDNFIYPFVVLFSIPVSLIGAFIALNLAMSSISIFTMLGVIMLLGLVMKNGILLVDFANHQKQQGASTRRALLEAGKARLRPIIMTTIAMVAGMIPIAIATGAGAEWKNGLAIVMMGGLLSSVMLTVFVVPMAYYIVDQIQISFAKFRKSRQLANVQP
jgi:hypothetical protein